MDNQFANKAKEVILRLTGYMNLDCEVGFEFIDSDKKTLFLTVRAPEDARVLIGRDGQALKSLEHLVRAIVLKEFEHERDLIPGIVVDVNDYKKSRINQVLEMAKHVMNKVKNTRKAEALAPMSPFERRIIHMELASCPDILTESIGDGDQRRVVIKPFQVV